MRPCEVLTLRMNAKSTPEPTGKRKEPDSKSKVQPFKRYKLNDDLREKAERFYTQYLQDTNGPYKRNLTRHAFFESLGAKFWDGNNNPGDGYELVSAFHKQIISAEIYNRTHLSPCVGQELPLLMHALRFLEEAVSEIIGHNTWEAHLILIAIYMIGSGQPGDSVACASVIKPVVKIHLSRIQKELRFARELQSSLKKSGVKETNNNVNEIVGHICERQALMKEGILMLSLENSSEWRN
jgi:hypothetical protein